MKICNFVIGYNIIYCRDEKKYFPKRLFVFDCQCVFAKFVRNGNFGSLCFWHNQFHVVE